MEVLQTMLNLESFNPKGHKTKSASVMGEELAEALFRDETGALVEYKEPADATTFRKRMEDFVKEQHNNLGTKKHGKNKNGTEKITAFETLIEECYEKTGAYVKEQLEEERDAKGGAASGVLGAFQPPLFDEAVASAKDKKDGGGKRGGGEGRKKRKVEGGGWRRGGGGGEGE